MPWCPKCKTEYVDGIAVCADCGERLVDSLEENGEQAFLFDDSGENENEDESKSSPDPYVGAYRGSAEKAEENRSSAYMLLIVGGIGLIAVLLILTGVIPLYQSASVTRYLVCGVMGALFVLFIVLGFMSMKSFRILSDKAKSESSLTEEISKWCDTNLQTGDIDASLTISEEMSEEQKYFLRSDRMKQMIQDKFINLDEAFLDHFIDDYYQKLFEEDQREPDS